MKKLLLTVVVFFTLTSVWGQSEEAKQAYNQGLDAYWDDADFELAVFFYSKAIRLYPQYAEAYLERGIIYYELEMYDDALADLSQVIKLEPNNARAYFYRGRISFDRTYYDAAITEFTQAIKFDPNHAPSYFYRGYVYELAKKDYIRAKADYEIALKDKVTETNARKRLDIVNAELAKAPSSAPSTPTPANMVLIKGGTFTMGSPANEQGRAADEVPHQVTVGSFYMNIYEVTQKEWREVMGNNPSERKGDTLPVENVSWYDAVEYCNKRSQKEGLTPVYTIDKNKRDPNNIPNEAVPAQYQDDKRWTVTWNKNANGYRLPTEAEWEYACRAGTSTAFNTGTAISENSGWHNKNSGMTHPVGQKPANAWGLYDMHGNVSEWCWDWYGNYPNGAQTNPAGSQSGTYRIERGGTFSSSSSFDRSASRAAAFKYPSDSYNALGFRVVLNAR